MPALTSSRPPHRRPTTAVGDVISYSYLVTNSGNVTLYDITVVDDKATVTCPDTSAGLAPLGQITCTASYTITQADLDFGSVTNTAYATDGTTQSEPDSETVNAVQSPGSRPLTRPRHRTTYAAVGDVISYSYLVTNTGNVTLYDITVVDDKATVTCPDTSSGLAPPGQHHLHGHATPSPGGPGLWLSDQHSLCDRTGRRNPNRAARRSTRSRARSDHCQDRHTGDLRRSGRRHQLQLPGDQQRQCNAV